MTFWLSKDCFSESITILGLGHKAAVVTEFDPKSPVLTSSFYYRKRNREEPDRPWFLVSQLIS